MEEKKKGDATKTEGIRRNVMAIGRKKQRRINLDFQCAACRELTAVSMRKPGKLTPTIVKKAECRVCGSASDLICEKLKDGRLRVKTIECFLTDEGRKHYYMYNREKEPGYVQPDGANDNQYTESQESHENETQRSSDECLPRETDSVQSEQCGGVSSSPDQSEV